MNTKKVISQDVQKEFADLIVSFVIEHGMTVSNIIDVLADVIQYFLDNAEIKM